MEWDVPLTFSDTEDSTTPPLFPGNMQLNWNLKRIISSENGWIISGNLSVDRIERLELIGFIWDTFEEQWMMMYDRLAMYKKKHKSTQVPSCYNGDNQLPYLGYWAVNQRVYYRDGKLLKKRVELLNSISFKWEVK